MEITLGRGEGLGWFLCTTRNVLRTTDSCLGFPFQLKHFMKSWFLSVPGVSIHLAIISVDGLSSITVCLAQDKNTKHNSTCDFRDIRKSGCPCLLPSSYSKNSTTNATLLWFLSRWVTITLTGRWVWPFPKIETKGEGCIGREDV